MMRKTMVAGVCLFLLFLTYHLFMHSFFLKTSEDVPIYAQAIALMGKPSFNPYVSVRGVHIFNDHFDPVVILVGLFGRFFPAAPLGYMVEFVCFVAALLLLKRFGKVFQVHPSVVSAAMIIFVGNGATLRAAFYPIHPTTWSVVAAVWVAVAASRKNFLQLIIALLMLALFKEVYVFAPLGVAAWLLFRKEYKWSFVFAGLSAVLSLAILVLRVQESNYYSFFANGMVYIIKRVVFTVATLIVPLVVLWLLKRRQGGTVNGDDAPLWPFIFVFLVTVLHGTVGAHHLIFLSAAAAVWVLASFRYVRFSAREIVLLMGMVAVLNIPYVAVKIVRDCDYFRRLGPGELMMRKRALDEALSAVRSYPEQRLFTTLQLAAHLPREDVHIFELFDQGQGPSTSASMLLLDKFRPFYFWTTLTDNAEIIARWKGDGEVETLLDNRYVFLGRKRI